MTRGLIALVVALSGCRGAPPAEAGDFDLAGLVDSLRPRVARAAGLDFRGPTRSALISRDAVRQYLLGKLRQEFPAQRQEGVEAAYRLLGLIPDSVDLKALLLELY